MNSTIWLALGLVLVLEGLGPMLFPQAAQNDCGDVAVAGRDAAAIWRWNSGCGLRDLLHVERPHGSLKSSPKFMQSYAKSAENRKLRW